MVSLSYSLFSQQNTVQQNTVWEVVNFDETTVDRYPNIPFRRCNNLIMDKVTKEGFLSTDYGLMKTQDGGFNWKPCMFNQQEWKASVSSVQGDKALVVVDYFIPGSSVYYLVSNFNTDEATMQYIYHYKPGYERDFPVERAPKSAFYKGKFYFVALDDEWKLYSLDLNGTKTEVNVIERNQDIGLWASTGIIDIFVKNNILYVITDKGQIYVQDSVLNLQKQIMRFTDGMLEISPESISYLFTDENICYLIQNMNPNYKGYYPPVSDIEVKLVDDRLKIRTINVFTNDKIKDMIFVDNNQGYIITEFSDDSYFRNYIYSTKNGGLSWKKEYETEEHLNNLYSIDGVVYAIKERGLLMRDNSNEGLRDNSNEGQIRVVVDGNYDNWVPAYIPARTPDTLRSVWCVSGNHCLAVGSDSNIVYRTRNSTDWIKEKLDIDPIRKHPFYQIYFKDEMIGSISSGLDVVFNTTDGGNTWTLEYTTNPDIVPGLSIGISPDGNIKLMSCPEGSSTYMTSWLASYPRTIPAYNRWRDLNTYGYLGYSINSLQFKDNYTAYAVGNSGGLYKYSCFGYYNERRVGMPYRTQLISQNGGVLNEDLFSMKIYGDTVYSVGDRGFYCSINLRSGYEEPNVISSGYIAKYENRSHYLHSIDFKTTNNMYIVGDNIILNSVDGGQTWQKQYIGDGTDTSLVPFKLRSIFVADSCVYAVGVGNVILRGRILPPVTDTTATQPEEKLTSIIDNQATALFYPNPADKFIEFKNLHNNAIVKIIDILGREVFYGKIIGNRLTVENYENGIYSLIISHGKEVRTGKFMVQH